MAAAPVPACVCPCVRVYHLHGRWVWVGVALAMLARNLQLISGVEKDRQWTTSRAMERAREKGLSPVLVSGCWMLADSGRKRKDGGGESLGHTA